jgi:hypothetical protein
MACDNEIFYVCVHVHVHVQAENKLVHMLSIGWSLVKKQVVYII